MTRWPSFKHSKKRKYEDMELGASGSGGSQVRRGRHETRGQRSSGESRKYRSSRPRCGGSVLFKVKVKITEKLEEAGGREGLGSELHNQIVCITYNNNNIKKSPIYIL